MALVLTDPPDQTDLLGGLNQLCSTFTASTLTDTRSFLISPTTAGGCTPTVSFVSANCGAMAPAVPTSTPGMTLSGGAYRPTGPAGRLVFGKPSVVCSYQYGLTGGTGSVVGGVGMSIEFVPPTGGVAVVGNTVAAAMGFTPNQLITPGTTGTAVVAGVTVKFTFVSGGVARVNIPSGAFLGRTPTDGDTTSPVFKFEYSVPVTSDQLLFASGALPAGQGVIGNQLITAPTATYQVCCQATAFGSYPYTIQEFDTFGGGDSSPPQSFTFTWQAVPWSKMSQPLGCC